MQSGFFTPTQVNKKQRANSDNKLQRSLKNADWLETLPVSYEHQLLQEYYSAGGNAAIKQIECPFCGGL
ncbi:hypothetical protein K435DRAFT_880419 [Dendrothele bispora CBS 962.96]|uniref:Uncharacterized protein n=1 Tax=Dendrothele bispora (strain CBS 962.96) TaxID=1314807 RepID=A0A4S8KJI4_DENBC|nr:hypothetical protein K435DRAFT_880419 [Dendrothele bispora CBS 962.96]